MLSAPGATVGLAVSASERKGSTGICAVGASRKSARGSEEDSGEDVGISTVASRFGVVGSAVVSSTLGIWVVLSSFEGVMVVFLPQLPDWELVGVSVGVSEGVGDGVASGADVHFRAASGD